jgi:hypothetical protein
MKKLLMLCAVCVSIAIAGSSTYNVTLFEPSIIGGQELKPGEYKLELKNNKVLVHNGKRNVAEASVNVENSDTKFGSTSIRYKNGDGKYRISEIRIGGTKTKLIVNEM